MPGVRFAARPHLMQQQSARRVDGPMQIITKAALFFSCGTNQRAQFRFEQRFLTLARPQDNDQANRFFRQSPGRSSRFARTTFRPFCSRFSRLALHHVGGDCNLNRSTRKHFHYANHPGQSLPQPLLDFVACLTLQITTRRVAGGSSRFSFLKLFSAFAGPKQPKLRPLESTDYEMLSCKSFLLLFIQIHGGAYRTPNSRNRSLQRRLPAASILRQKSNING